MHDSPGDHIGRLQALLHLAGTLQAHAETRLSEVGLSLPKLAALTKLSEAGESLPLSQLAARLSCVKSNITQLVDRLEADGFVSRAADSSDRRSRLAVMTPAGRAAFEKGAQIYQQTERDLLSELDEVEARYLTSLIEKLEKRAG
jgi:DNA-binding MarR family transcriptional regulator